MMASIWERRFSRGNSSINMNGMTVVPFMGYNLVPLILRMFELKWSLFELSWYMYLLGYDVGFFSRNNSIIVQKPVWNTEMWGYVKDSYRPCSLGVNINLSHTHKTRIWYLSRVSSKFLRPFPLLIREVPLPLRERLHMCLSTKKHIKVK